jgi:hypothetical protein
MKKSFKMLIIIAMGISSFAILILYSFQFSPSTNPGPTTGRNNPLPEVYNISLTVEYVTQPSDTWDNISLMDYKTSVLDALKEKCIVVFSIFGNGAFVMSINNVNGSWVYYVNGLFASVGAADYYLNNGDSIHWKHVNV